MCDQYSPELKFIIVVLKFLKFQCHNSQIEKQYD